MKIKNAHSQIVFFAIIGSIGFLVDGAVLTAFSVAMGMNIYFSRLVSFSMACLVTWILNRKHTFKFISEKSKISPTHEYLRYLTVQVGGALINLSIFTWLVAENPTLKSIPILPLAAGSGVALIFNFLFTRVWVYGNPPIN